MGRYANQYTVTIKKTPVKGNFLQISNEEWMLAAKKFDKKFNPFKLYLYLAANEVGYSKDLSQVAVENALGIKRSSYYDSMDCLIEEGYLVDRGGGKMDFYTTPQKSATAEIEMKDLKSARMENSVSVEFEEKDIKSARVEKSILAEKYTNDIKSASVENSTVAENRYETFNF